MFHEIMTIAPREIIKGYKGRFIHTGNMTIAFWEVEAGATIPLHHHIHEQVCHVLEGKFKLSVGDECRELEPGVVATIPPGTPHSGTAVTDCKLLDIFSPEREDYK